MVQNVVKRLVIISLPSFPAQSPPRLPPIHSPLPLNTSTTYYKSFIRSSFSGHFHLLFIAILTQAKKLRTPHERPKPLRYLTLNSSGRGLRCLRTQDSKMIQPFGLVPIFFGYNAACPLLSSELLLERFSYLHIDLVFVLRCHTVEFAISKLVNDLICPVFECVTALDDGCPMQVRLGVVYAKAFRLLPIVMTLASHIVDHILEISGDDYGFLYRCSLVNWEFTHAASRLLYFRVVLSPPFKPVLNLRDTGSIPETSNFSSALIERNAPHVRKLEISGFIFPRPPPRNMISEKISSGLKHFINLRSVKLVPTTYHEELFVHSLPILPELNALNEVEVNSSCFDEPRAPMLVKLRQLRKLSLINPGRAILQLLPDWLSRLSESLVELHLSSNCGSITPGVLKSFIPHIRHSIRALTLGLSYSLTNEDVFAFLAELSNLERLQLHYYWQLKRPNNPPRLLALRSFTVTYNQIHSKKYANELDKWIRRTIGGSPKLEEVYMVCDRPDLDERDTAAAVAHDAIVDHIVRKHAETIRVLCFRSAFVTVKRLKELLGACSKLEECHLRVGKQALSILASLREKLPALHTVSFQICNVKRAHQVEESVISELLRGSAALRRLKVNGSAWEAVWKTRSEDESVELVVERDWKRKPPWSH